MERGASSVGAEVTVDCMACLVAMAKGEHSNSTYTDRHGITHATSRHSSYGTHQALTCTFSKDGSLRLVPR